ncbi:hypothetical protein HDU92_007116 [Lobulomyces angularis]|nr:hypothetical protein HDU92_007116 [Lobulomyces angularis]
MSILIAPTQQMIIVVVCDRMIGFQSSDNNNQTISKLPSYKECSSNPQVSSQSASWGMIFQLAASIPGMLTLPIIGMISDKFGRKIAFIFPAIGSLVQFLITIFVLVKKSSLWFLFLANFFHGILGGFMVLEAIVFAYIADVTTGSPTDLFGKVEALMFSAFMFGPLMGGILVRVGNGVILPFLVASESLNSKKAEKKSQQKVDQTTTNEEAGEEDSLLQSPSEKKSFNIIEIFKTSLSQFLSNIQVLFAKERKSQLQIVFVMITFSFGIGIYHFLLLYTGLKFHWDSFDYSQYIFVVAFIRIFYMAIFLPYLVKLGNKWYANDEIKNVTYQLYLARFAILYHVVSYILNAFAVNSFQYYMIGMFDGLQSIATPLLRGLLSNSTSPKDQGKLFASIALFQQLAGIFTAIIFLNLYNSTVGTFPGAIFLASAGFYLIGFIISFGIDKFRLKPYKDLTVTVVEEEIVAVEEVLQV